jgi:hypothetical protein
MKEPPAPLRAPAMKRRIRMRGHRWAGLLLLSVLPVLAVAGVFQTTTVTEAANEALSVRVHHPVRALAFEVQSVVLVAQARRDCLPLTIELAPPFVEAVEELHLLPTPSEGYLLQRSVSAGQAFHAALEFKLAHAGRLKGQLQVRCGPSTPISVGLSILVFP